MYSASVRITFTQEASVRYCSILQQPAAERAVPQQRHVSVPDGVLGTDETEEVPLP